MTYQNRSCVRVSKKNTPAIELPYQTIQPVVYQPHCDYPQYDGEYRRHENERTYPEWSYPDLEKAHECPPVIPNPIYPANATLPLLTPVAVTQTGNTVFVTASIPAEAIITLPSDALEIKRISKKLKITQCRFFNPPTPVVPGVPLDTPKLFIGGFVRKDIQYSQMRNRTATTVEGDIRDFVVDIPVSGVVNLGAGLTLPTFGFGNEQEYEFARRRLLGTGFPDKERLLGSDLTEFNVVTNQLLNRLPFCELIATQINEMDEQLDRTPLCGGPFEEGTFRTLQEKMVVVVQVAVTFPPVGTPPVV